MNVYKTRPEINEHRFLIVRRSADWVKQIQVERARLWQRYRMDICIATFACEVRPCWQVKSGRDAVLHSETQLDGAVLRLWRRERGETVWTWELETDEGVVLYAEQDSMYTKPFNSGDTNE